MHWIGFDSERLKSPQSGLGKFCEYLGKALVKSGKFDYLFFQKKKTPRIFPEPAQYAPLYDHNKLMGVSAGVDLWHCTHQLSSYLPLDKKIPVVTTIHDLNFLHTAGSEGKIKRKLSHVQHLVNRSQAVVFISKFTQQEASEHLNLEGKIQTVIYNGPALDENHRNHTEFKHPRPYFFSVGLITRKKNFHTLVPLLKYFPSHDLIIAGNRSDKYAGQMVDTARKLGVADRLILTGEITEREKADYFHHCDAFMFPSLAEGFGLPALEAMHFGKPIFLSNEGSLPEIGGNAAYYFPSFDEEEMVQTVRKGMANHGEDMVKIMKQRAEEFCWKKAADAYEELYLQVLSGSAK